MNRSHWIAIILFCATIPTFLIPLRLGLIPNLFDLVTGIVASGIVVLIGSGIAILYRSSKQKQSAVPTVFIKDPSLRGVDFTKVGAHLFYPWYYWYLPFSLLFKRDLNHIPRKKLVVNHKTNPPKAYWMCEYALNAIKAKRISWVSEKKQDLAQWCKDNRYDYVKRCAEEADLTEGA